MKFLSAISAAAAIKLSHKSTQPGHGPGPHGPPTCDEVKDGLEMMFMMMDQDGSGGISADEAIAFGIPPADIEMLGALDEDNNGELTPEELLPLANMVLADYGCEGF